MAPRLSLILVAATGASLAACGGPSEDGAGEADVFAMTGGKVEDKFGKDFGNAYRADPNSEPAQVTEGDVPPVSLTSEPVPIE